MTMEMRLAAEPFEKIKSGEKTVEIRLCDEKRRAINIGDDIIFYKGDGRAERVLTSVVGLHRFDSFAELFSSELFAETGCGGKTLQEAVNSMYAFYTKEQERKYGVLGIEIKLK